MKKRIFFTVSGVALASVLLALILSFFLYISKTRESIQQRLQMESGYIAAGVESDGLSFLESVKNGKDRITWIAADGVVLFDSQANVAGMENHKERIEVAQAIQTGAGTSERLSETLSLKTFYFALRMSDGTVLRLGTTVDSAIKTATDLIPLLIGIFLLMVIVAAYLSRWQARRILEPLNNIDIENPLDNNSYPELSPMLRRIAHQTEEGNARAQELKAARDEFEIVAENLSEGLILLNRTGSVLSMNKSASRILGTDPNISLPQHLLVLKRSLELEKAVNRAAEGQRSEFIWNSENKQYRATASPVKQEDRVSGVALLLIDETEILRREALRREFSANVSHELKTPLTSITGYAEIMKNGLVKPEDMEQFATRIYEESKRLSALVDDILQLSRLDEKETPFEKEMVDLLIIARDVTHRLTPHAEAAEVTLQVVGESAKMIAAPAIMEEILFNLCENTIKYNRPGGSVLVEIGSNTSEVFVKVQDTGQGIPNREQHRVFERFYRVDKSHSKQTGGTGLGLSIVKHGVQAHDGSVELFSEEGKGTTVTVRFPLIATDNGND